MQTFSPRPGVTIAYNKTAGSPPGIIFFSGFRSDMTGAKATYLEERCKSRGQAYLRFDYTAHGKSSGFFETSTIGGWLQDSLDVFDQLTEGPQIVVGSSMGGWLSLLLALRRKERLKGLVLLAPAPDFTEDLLRLFSPAQKQELEENGVVYVPNAYAGPHPFTKQLIEEARQYLVLRDTIDLPCPVRIIHGKQDADVPWMKSQHILEKLKSPDVRVTWVEDGDHRLSRPQDLELIDNTVKSLV